MIAALRNGNRIIVCLFWIFASTFSWGDKVALLNQLPETPIDLMDLMFLDVDNDFSNKLAPKDLTHIEVALLNTGHYLIHRDSHDNFQIFRVHLFDNRLLVFPCEFTLADGHLSNIRAKREFYGYILKGKLTLALFHDSNEKLPSPSHLERSKESDGRLQEAVPR